MTDIEVLAAEAEEKLKAQGYTVYINSVILIKVMIK